MDNFVAIDFETANCSPSSICAVGVVVVKDGEFVNSYYSLVKPDPNYYNYFCTRVHGLTRRDTDDAPNFPDVWNEVSSLIKDLPFVAHNSKFDESCLKAAFKTYNLTYPDYIFYDTLKAAKKTFPKAQNHQLDTVADLCGFTLLDHHNALADAKACAWIAREIL